MIFRAHAYLLLTALVVVGSAWAFQKPPLLPPGVSIFPAPETNATVPSVDTNSSQPTKPVRSSQAQTIQQAGRDLRHVEENVRLGAAKLLGKYPGLNTAALLAMALDDRAPRVRRAAIVSIAELYSNGYYLYEKSIVEKILSKLGDVDVEVRREVSALIPRLSIGLFRSSFEIVEINGRKVARSRPATLRPDLRQLALKCLSDEDAIVRQNILKYFAFSTPFGIFEMTRVPMGAKNSGAYFQKTMSEVLKPLENQGVMVYLDDVLVVADSDEQLLKRIKDFFNVLNTRS